VADDGVLLLAVADALGQGERGGHHVAQAQREKGTNHRRVVQVANADDGHGQGDSEGNRRLNEERNGGAGAEWSAHKPMLGSAQLGA
jgi:hypothetical protein